MLCQYAAAHCNLTKTYFIKKTVMAGDFLGGLGGLMKGLSGFMPQDDPAVKMMNNQTEVNDFKKQETEIFAQIGKQVVEQQGTVSFGELGERLKLVQINLAAAEAKLKAAQQEQEAAQQAENEAAEQSTCPECGLQNADGVKFCQECGAKLAVAKVFCSNCGAENAPGTKFCGSCGTKIGE